MAHGASFAEARTGVRGGNGLGRPGLRAAARRAPDPGLRPCRYVPSLLGGRVVEEPHGLRVDRDDHVWVTDTGRHVVMKFDAGGKVLLSLGKKDEPGDGPDRFNKPTDVAVSASGEIYVSDGYGNARVVKFSKEGKFVREWGKKGSGDGEFNLPHS